jgi:hypothetical protein
MSTLTGDCSASSGYTPLFNYTWPGTVDGCDCTNVDPTIASTKNIETSKDIFKK